MASYITTVADAVASAINAASLSQVATVTRVYEPRDTNLDATDSIQVRVVPRQCSMSPLSRHLKENDIVIDVGIIKHIGSTADPSSSSTNSTIDALVQYAEEIANLFVPGTYGGAAFVNSTIDPVYDPDHLRENRQFVSVVSLSFKISS